MSFAVQQGKSLRIWCDNDTVVRKLKSFQAGQVRIKQSATNADLWCKAQRLVSQLGQKLQVIKVNSLQDLSTARDEAEGWIFAGNEAADTLSLSVFSNNIWIYKLWTQLQTDIEAIHVMRNQVHNTIVAGAKEAIKHGPPREIDQDKQHPSRIGAEKMKEVDFSHLADLDYFPARYNCSEGHRNAEWLQTVCEQGEHLQPISWFQLCVLFEYQTNPTGVRHNKSRKKWENLSTSLKSCDLVARTKSFSKWVQGMSSSRSRPITPLHLCPDSEVLGFWTMCIPVRIKHAMKQFADSALRGSSPRLMSVPSLRRL